MSEIKTENKCDDSPCKTGLITQLHHAQNEALDVTAGSLRSIINLQKLAIRTHSDYVGNILDAKKDVIDAMVNLAVASSEEGMKGVRKILSGYGLEDMI